MKHLFKILLVSLCLLGAGSAQAQWYKKLGNKLLKKAEKKTEQRIEQAGDKTTDRALDSVFNKKNGKRKKNRERTDSNGAANSPFGSMKGLEGMMDKLGKKVETAPSYTFKTTIEMERFGDGVGKDRTMIQRLGENITLTEVPEAKIILDDQRNIMITLQEDTKEAYAVDMSFMEDILNMSGVDVDESYEEPTISSLGTTVEIAGYTCRHKSITTSKQRIDLWYTKDVDIDSSAYMSMFKSLPKNLQKSQDAFTKLLDGFVMQMDFVDKETDTFFGTKVKSIDFKETTVIMADYKMLHQ